MIVYAAGMSDTTGARQESCSLSRRTGLGDWVPADRLTIALMISSLLLAAVFMLAGITRGEFSINGADEAFNATTGIYFADFARDLPLHNAVEYTYEYYAQYPALSLVHWPPLFHIVEGAIFWLVGPSVVAARFTVLLFSLFGLAFWFRLVRDLDDDWTAAICTVLLAGCPSVLLYEKSAMLEIPSLSLCMAALFYWQRYARRGAAKNAYWFALFAGLALLTKQQSVFLAPVALLMLLAVRKWRLIFAGPTWGAFGLSLLLAGPFYVFSMSLDSRSIKGNLLKGLGQATNPFLYYPDALPEKLGLTLLIASLLGLLYWTRWWRDGALAMLAWMAGWYLTFSAIATKDTRYTVYWLPPFVYFAVAPIVAYIRPRLSRVAAATALVAVVSLNSWSALAYERPYVSGYESLARRIVRDAGRGVLLFDGDLAGNFVFFMRAADPNRRFIVLRKALYATEVMAQFGKEDLIHSEAELDALMKDYGVEYIVIEKGTPIEFESQQILRNYLVHSQFKLIEDVPIASNTQRWNSRSLLVYKNAAAAAPTARLLRVRMLSMGHDIVVPLDKYLRR